MHALFALPLAFSPTSDPTSAVAADFTREAHGLQRLHERLIGAGPDYRAEFETTYVRYVPALGARAPRDFPVDYAVAGASVGTAALELSSSAEPTMDGTTVRYDRGGFVERYEIRADGVEQSFVFHELPARGDLVVRGTLFTELPLASQDPSSGLSFELDGVGGVRYGGVTGIDANGVKAPGWIRLEGDRLELGLPAAFVSSAALPLVLDPLIGTTLDVDDSGNDDWHPDAVSFQDRVMIVWERRFSVSKSDIRGRIMGMNGAPIVNLLTINSGLDCTLPAVGVFEDGALGPQFLVAYQQTGVGLDQDVWAPSLQDTNWAVHTALALDASLSSDALTPDVGRGAKSGPVVWNDESGIRAMGLKQFGGGGPLISWSGNVSTDPNDSVPAISKSCAGKDYAMVAWRRDGGANDWIQGRRFEVGQNATLWPSEFQVSTPSLFNPDTPDVASGANDDHYVVWVENNGPGNRDVYGRRVFFPGSSPNYGATVAVEADVNDDEYAPTIGYAAHQYLVAFLDSAGFPNYFCDAKAIDPMTGALLETQLTIGGPGPMTSPVVAGESCSDADPQDDFFLVWSQESGGGDMDLFGQLVEGVGGSTLDLGGGCTLLGGEVRVSGATAGNGAFQLELWGGEPQNLAVLMAGTQQIAIPYGQATLFVLPTTFLSAGANTIDGHGSVTVPLGPGTSGVKFIAQWLVFSGGSACSGIGYNFSDALQVSIE